MEVHPLLAFFGKKIPKTLSFKGLEILFLLPTIISWGLVMHGCEFLQF